MFLIELLLPLYGNEGNPIPRTVFSAVRDELVGHFGGLTAHTRAPVDGLWREDDQPAIHDDLIIYEVMAPELDEEWWQRYRTTLEARFRQEQIIIRAVSIDLL